jgi:hypothetical protein
VWRRGIRVPAPSDAASSSSRANRPGICRAGGQGEGFPRCLEADRIYPAATSGLVLEIFGLAASETVDHSCGAGAGVRLGERSCFRARPYASTSNCSGNRHNGRRSLTPIGGGRGEFAVGDSPRSSFATVATQRWGRTIAHVTEAAGPPHVDSQPRGGEGSRGVPHGGSGARSPHAIKAVNGRAFSGTR